MAFVRTETLGGVPVHYDRFTHSSYGTEGTPFKPTIDETFFNECNACFSEMAGLFKPKFGDLNIIVSGGVSRAGTGSSLHHANRAFDLDCLFFDDTHWVANTFPERPHIYLAIESVIRKHFGTVLTYDYNSAHEDHIHFDNGTQPGFQSMSKSRVTYLQNAIFYLYDIEIGLDGVYGPETAQAARQVRAELEIGGFSETANWAAFLTKNAAAAVDRAT